MFDRLHRLRRGAVIGAAALAAMAVLASCGGGNDNGQNSLDPAGPEAGQILDLFTPFFWIAVVIGVGVVGGTIFVALRFREKPGEDRSPKQVHGNTVLEISWTIIPALILMVMAVFTIPVIFDLSEKPTGDDVVKITSPAGSGSGSTSTPTTSSSPPTRCTSRSAGRSAWRSPRPRTASSTRSGCPS